jgi:peptide-methionine (S)-S-oxide reductase
MSFLFRKPSMPHDSEVLPGRPEPMPGLAPHVLSRRSLVPPYPHGLEIADVAMGCFWGAEKKFWHIPGVWVTAVGYQGGGTPNPTYQEVCTGRTGHAEAVRIVFDPAVVGYERILKTFWESHDPTQGYRQGNDVGTQYRSAIYTHGPEQLAVALASRDRYQAELAKAGFGAITTEIREAPAFFFAEDYHQGYLVKNPNGYDCHTATGVACPIGVGVPVATMGTGDTATA